MVLILRLRKPRSPTKRWPGERHFIRACSSFPERAAVDRRLSVHQPGDNMDSLRDERRPGPFLLVSCPGGAATIRPWMIQRHRSLQPAAFVGRSNGNNAQ